MSWLAILLNVFGIAFSVWILRTNVETSFLRISYGLKPRDGLGNVLFYGGVVLLWFNSTLLGMNLARLVG